MPQGRIVLKSICQSRKLAGLKSDGARLLYTWLLPNVDVEGRYSGDPQVIKGQIFTRLRKSAKVIQNYLEDLHENKLILLYQANGDMYLQIPDFIDKQPHINPDREAESAIPPPTPDQLQTGSRPPPPLSKGKESKVEVKVKDKKQFFDFVFLTPEEYQKLVDKIGKVETDEKIVSLNEYIGSKGVRYASHYHTILSWARKDAKKVDRSCRFFGGKGFCGKPGVYYTKASGWRCEEHNPKAKVNLPVPNPLKEVPQPDKRSVSDKANAAKIGLTSNKK